MCVHALERSVPVDAGYDHPAPPAPHHRRSPSPSPYPPQMNRGLAVLPALQTLKGQVSAKDAHFANVAGTCGRTPTTPPTPPHPHSPTLIRHTWLS